MAITAFSELVASLCVLLVPLHRPHLPVSAHRTWHNSAVACSRISEATAGCGRIKQWMGELRPSAEQRCTRFDVVAKPRPPVLRQQALHTFGDFLEMSDERSIENRSLRL